MHTLTTPRLIGTPAAPADFADLHMLHSDSRVTATLSADGNPFTETQTRDFLARAAEHWSSYGFGLWMLHDRSSSRFVGYGGIKHTIVEGHDEIELAYAIAFDSQRSGFATEISQAALNFAFSELHLDHIVAFTLPHNKASRRVMEHCGFIYDRGIVHAGLPHVLYILHARDFVARQP
jgi:RimJ/RimL family protein N-acetyltransferase